MILLMCDLFCKSFVKWPLIHNFVVTKKMGIANSQISDLILGNLHFQLGKNLDTLLRIPTMSFWCEKMLPNLLHSLFYARRRVLLAGRRLSDCRHNP